MRHFLSTMDWDRAELQAMLNEAKRLGCTRAQVETAEPHPDKLAVSLKNSRAAGFDVAYVRAN